MIFYQNVLYIVSINLNNVLNKNSDFFNAMNNPERFKS
jgi:hypothetical protein